jgi:hypothetical protein
MAKYEEDNLRLQAENEQLKTKLAATNETLHQTQVC